MECSWQKAHETIMAFRKEIQELHRQDVHREFAKNVALHIDSKTLGMELGEATEVKPYWFAQGVLRERHEKEPAYFDLSLFPFRGEIYGMSFTSQNDSTWTDLWFSKDLVEEYRYWNNTDRPKGISESMWDHRAKAWDQILDGFGSVPSMNGFTAQCLEKYPPLVKPGDLVPFLPIMKDRAYIISCEIFLREWKKDNQDGNPFKFFGWLRENQGKLSQEIARVTPLLTTDLTTEIDKSL
jgi:hypothetical protein